MKGVYPDASDGLADIYRRVVLPHDPVITLHEHKLISAAELPDILAGHDFVLNDHTFLPTETMARCSGCGTSSSSAPARAAIWMPRRWRTSASPSIHQGLWRHARSPSMPSR